MNCQLVCYLDRNLNHLIFFKLLVNTCNMASGYKALHKTINFWYKLAGFAKYIKPPVTSRLSIQSLWKPQKRCQNSLHQSEAQNSLNG